MADNHPIIPPHELVRQWDKECDSGYNPEIDNTFDALKCFASKAAQWGADQELEACCALMDDWGLDEADLRAIRRPNPPSLKKQAQAELDRLIALIPSNGALAMAEPIRRALEQLDD